MIRINLLAESQAAEERRLRDPAKRAVWIAGFAIALVLLWSLSIQFKISRAQSELTRQEKYWASIEPKHRAATETLKNTAAIEQKLAALNRLSTNRFFYGSTLNALQLSVVDPVQVLRLKFNQSFTFVEGSAPVKVQSSKADESNAQSPKPKVAKAIPAAAVEKLSLTIEARDWNPPELNYNKYKEALANLPYFKASLNGADALRLTALSKPTADAANPSQSFVLFTLEMKYPEVSRHE